MNACMHACMRVRVLLFHSVFCFVLFVHINIMLRTASSFVFLFLFSWLPPGCGVVGVVICFKKMKFLVNT